MEFLPAQGTPTYDKNGKRNEPITRVRLAWYYRPSDVSDRTVADCRLLLAAIYSEVCELSQLRSKCYVLHRDRISDLAGWKKRPDRFYFTRLFDPWLRKEFEVIPATTVRNGRFFCFPCGIYVLSSGMTLISSHSARTYQRGAHLTLRIHSCREGGRSGLHRRSTAL